MEFWVLRSKQGMLVIAAQAGILGVFQKEELDSRLRGNDRQVAPRSAH